MSEITLTIVKVLFLALLWLFIASIVSVIRSDLFGKAVPNRAGQQLNEPAAPARRTRRQRGRPRRVAITNGSQSGQSADLVGETGENAVVMIGRGSDCALILDDDYVSTRHARVVLGEAGPYIEDLGSTNGTYVNGQRITAPTSLTLADTVRIGKTLIKLET
ncbi:pSer/pThr/pTyr-binding forkhead associated (FHA) protein [Friedmanniella endophytica]|uniref:PSer/pThr/pTyr-binding forkhead associated (FHA) protein n=1 Tax=Microlunatus kandeliicorticis TaxID=1759536 RepID=A0A7W3IRE7_9ACTN|nr:FHA domain-containing protein [Microlunatus kandeliicorticis]MBA8793803.1 pSer/pThr/pTyr-binding forkhead associated (FHA) protein [Microlunatus kandeliicorticis]